MRSLNNLFPEAKVVKVDQREGRNAVYLRAPEVSWEAILEAEKRANKIIEEEREVREQIFPSLEEARRAFPDLRAMEERITGEVRVVEVEGYDHAACNRAHVENSRDCGFFIITSLSKSGEVYELEFEAGEKAKVKALDISALSITIANILGVSLKTLEKTVLNMQEELLDLRRRLAKFSEMELERIQPSEKAGLKVFVGDFSGLDRRRMMEKAGEFSSGEKTVVILADKDGEAFVVLSGSRDLAINCGETLKEVLGRFGGKGGGNPNFASGMVRPERLREVFDEILAHISSKGRP